MFKTATVFTHPPRRAETRLSSGEVAARSATRRIMNVLFADAGETVSAQEAGGRFQHPETRRENHVSDVLPGSL
jgi:hypothetical protein